METIIWKSKPGEKTPGQFSYMNEAYQHSYVMNILQLKEEDRSTFEKVILTQYQRHQSYKNNSDKYLDIE